jgi:DNA-binding NarL/FixJ family response regulator
MDKIRVAIVDDHPLFREGISRVLAGAPDIAVVAEGGSAQEAAAIADNKKPDVIVLDIGIPGNGIAALEAIVATHPEVRVLMLSVSDSKADVFEAFRLGAIGYLEKGLRASELVDAVRRVAQGQQYLSSGLGAKLVSQPILADGSLRESRPVNLTVREAQILGLVKLGLSNKAVGARLGLSDKTVKHYMTNLFQKLGVRSRLAAAISASESETGHTRGTIQVLVATSARPTGEQTRSSTRTSRKATQTALDWRTAKSAGRR